MQLFTKTPPESSKAGYQELIEIKKKDNETDQNSERETLNDRIKNNR